MQICEGLDPYRLFFGCDAKAGSSIAARIAMMAMTTSNSINVKARLDCELNGERDGCVCLCIAGVFIFESVLEVSTTNWKFLQ
jgi:hypothetical protein